MQLLRKIRVTGRIRKLQNLKRILIIGYIRKAQRFSTSSVQKPSIRVRQLIEAGTINKDEIQDRVLEEIDKLHIAIESYKPPPLPPVPSRQHSSGTFNKKTVNNDDKSISTSTMYFQSFFGFNKSKSSNSAEIDPFYSPNLNPPQSIYIYGGTGTGKTMLTDIFYESITSHSKERVHFNKFMLELHDEIHRRTRETGKSADEVLPELSLNIANKSRIFYIDEFQVQDLVDALLLNRLFTALFYYGVIFFFTSNRDPDMLYLNGPQRRDAWEPFLSLFKSHCNVIDLNTINYRDIEDGYGYFIDDPSAATGSGSGDGRTQFENCWASFVHKNESESSVSVPVMAGRELICPRSIKNIATRFKFVELCKTNCGSADYIALSKSFNIIFIEDIPYFHFLNRPEMKRFIWLIDELYNGKNRIVCLASDKPDNLLQIDIDKENVFEDVFQFERCKKRLCEMKSKKFNLHYIPQTTTVNTQD